jgi:microcin C transport system substrate-binding protein
VPQWYRASHWIAYWDVFGRPVVKGPRYERGIPETWWHDAEKAKRIERAG